MARETREVAARTYLSSDLHRRLDGLDGVQRDEYERGENRKYMRARLVNGAVVNHPADGVQQCPMRLLVARIRQA